MKKSRVFTASWGQIEGNCSNMGDIVIFEAIVEILQSAPSISKIYCYSSDPEYTNRKYKVHSENPFSFRGCLKTIRNGHKSDLILLGGGELVQTKSSVLYLIANLAPGILALIFGKKCLAIGVGIGNKEEISFFGKILARFVLNRIDGICVRGNHSFKNALAIGIRKDKLLQSNDLAFYFDNVDINHRRGAKDTVFFSPRFTGFRRGSILPASLTKRLNSNTYSKAFNDAAANFAGLLEKLASKYKIIIFPSYRGENFSSEDVAFSQRILELAGSPKNVKIYDGPIRTRAILHLLTETFLTVGVPLHVLILTSIVNNPIISISYSSKCTNFMKDLGIDDFVIDISKSLDNLKDYNILRLIEKCTLQKVDLEERIKKKVKVFRKQNELNIRQVKSLLNE